MMKKRGDIYLKYLLSLTMLILLWSDALAFKESSSKFILQKKKGNVEWRSYYNIHWKDLGGTPQPVSIKDHIRIGEESSLEVLLVEGEEKKQIWTIELAGQYSLESLYLRRMQLGRYPLKELPLDSDSGGEAFDQNKTQLPFAQAWKRFRVELLYSKSLEKIKKFTTKAEPFSPVQNATFLEKIEWLNPVDQITRRVYEFPIAVDLAWKSQNQVNDYEVYVWPIRVKKGYCQLI